jgi:hypothetical protein
MYHGKSDNHVGRSSGPAVGGGKQTSDQADLVNMRQEADTARAESTNPGDPGLARGNPATGGSSGGHSDQIASQGSHEDQKVADGHYETEQTDGHGISEGKMGKRPSGG